MGDWSEPFVNQRANWLFNEHPKPIFKWDTWTWRVSMRQKSIWKYANERMGREENSRNLIRAATHRNWQQPGGIRWKYANDEWISGWMVKCKWTWGGTARLTNRPSSSMRKCSRDGSVGLTPLDVAVAVAVAAVTVAFLRRAPGDVSSCLGGG